MSVENVQDVAREGDEAEEKPDPPAVLQSNNLTARVLRQKLWRPANVENDWAVFVMVGREGTGKSLTTASILEKVDPSFSAERAHFDALDFLEAIESDKTSQGDAVMLDESGVSLGNRTWYDRGQIEFNQAMQTARDDNMIVGLTLPRLEELDKQFQGRIHALLETVDKVDGEYVEFKWKNVNPTRDGRDELYKWYPRMRVNGRVSRVTRLRLGPPSAALTESYQAKKAAWKKELYDSTVGTMRDDRDDGEEELSPKEIAEDIISEERIDEYIGDNYGQKYIQKDLIAADYGLGVGQSKQVKTVLLREVDDDIM